MADLNDENIVQGLFSFLNEYIVTHFKAEEQLMIDYNYEKYEYHKKIHDEFLNTINKKIKKYNNNKSIEIIYSIRNQVSKWLVHHILNVDIQMKRFYLSIHE